jgi:hypothetical protein
MEKPWLFEGLLVDERVADILAHLLGGSTSAEEIVNSKVVTGSCLTIHERRFADFHITANDFVKLFINELRFHNFSARLHSITIKDF